MEDGTYNFCLDVDGHSGVGTLTLNDDRGQGHDGRFKLEVQLIGPQHAMKGLVNVLMRPEARGPRRLPEHYSLQMAGSAQDATFNLAGIGPDGVLVRLDARRA